MSCTICAPWNQTDPNCGHFLIDGIIAPARFVTRASCEGMEIGGRAIRYARSENSDFGDAPRIEHIVRQAEKALAGGWKRA